MENPTQVAQQLHTLDHHSDMLRLFPCISTLNMNSHGGQLPVHYHVAVLWARNNKLTRVLLTY